MPDEYRDGEEEIKDPEGVSEGADPEDGETTEEDELEGFTVRDADGELEEETF